MVDETKPAALKPKPTTPIVPAERVRPAAPAEAHKPAEHKAAEHKPAEHKPAEAKPAEAPKTEAKAEHKPADVKHEAKPVEHKPVENKPVEHKPAEAKSEPSKAQHAAPVPAEAKPAPVAHAKSAEAAKPAPTKAAETTVKTMKKPEPKAAAPKSVAKAPKAASKAAAPKATVAKAAKPEKAVPAAKAAAASATPTLTLVKSGAKHVADKAQDTATRSVGFVATSITELPSFAAIRDPMKAVSELPNAYKSFAEAGLDQARDAYSRMKNSAETLSAGVETSTKAASDGLHELQSRVVDAVQSNLEATFGLARAMTHVRSFSEVLELNATHARKQFETVTAQFRDITSLAGRTLNATAEPMRKALSDTIRTER